MPPDPIHKCEWCSEPLDESGECPNEMCEGNMTEDCEESFGGNDFEDWSEEPHGDDGRNWSGP